MKGVLLAGGTGSRLYPLTKVTNKHLLPLGNQPMIFHPILKMIEAEITEILIVTGPEHMGDIVNSLGSGREFGCEFTYKVQDEAGGIAQALGLAENFANQSSVCVVLGDNIFHDPIRAYVQNFLNQGSGAKLLLKQVEDPERYGVAEVKNGTIIGIEEKPDVPKSSFAVTGIYLYDAEVFQVIPTLTRSQRGELEITDVNNYYIQKGTMTYDILEGWWTDAGTFSSYQLANKLFWQDME